MILNDTEPTESFEDRFNKIASKQQPESWTEFLDRTQERLRARSAETILGFPGNFKKAFQQSADFIESFLPDDFRQDLQLSKGKPAEEGTLESFFMQPPTSQELREKVTKKISEKKYGEKDYLEPRGKLEEVIDEFDQDLTSMFMPGTGQMRIATRIGAPVVGNLVKQGLDYLGVEKKTSEKAKMGTMLMFSLANESRPIEFGDQRIQTARNMVPQNMTVDVRPLAQDLYPLYQRLQRGFNVPSKSRTMQGIRELAEESNLNNGRLNMQSLMDARNNINEWISEAGGWDVPAPTRDSTVRNLNQLKREIIRTIDTNLQTRLPEAAELYRSGYEANAVTHQSNAISNFINRNYGKAAASVGAKILFPGLAGGALFAPKMAATASLGYPIYKAGQVLYRIGRSPTLANYYVDVIRNAMQGNSQAMIQSLSKLDTELKKDEDKKKKGKKMTLEEFKSSFMHKD